MFLVSLTGKESINLAIRLIFCNLHIAFPFLYNTDKRNRQGEEVHVQSISKFTH